MELLDALLDRRSIRKYKNTPLPEEFLYTILKAGMYSPSAANTQPWEFILIQKRETLEKIGNLHPHFGMAREAAAGIVVCGNLNLEKYPGFWMQDCAACTQNMLLAIHGLGLGGVWCGIHPIEEKIMGFKRIFTFPEKVIPLSFIAFGYPDQTLARPERYKAERIHHEQW
jgi:nitroreductase